MYPTYEEVADSLNTHHPSLNGGEDQRSLGNYGYIPPHLPGHTLIIIPPVVVSNLLPCDLHYYFSGTDVAGKLNPGQDATLHNLHLAPGSQSHSPLILGCGLEGFKDCTELSINHLQKNSQMRMCMRDLRDRSLILNVRVSWRLDCSVKISIMSGYWIVNKTGLPLIIKQEGARGSAAGQYEEHERARSLTPLLFSYSDRDLPYLCTMRLGKEASQEVGSGLIQKYPNATAAYCHSFSIDGGTCTRNLTIINHDCTPSRVYYIGVGVRRGWGRYRHTHIVTLAPRFLLVNLTKKHTLSFAQVHATSFTEDSSGRNRHLTIIPGSSVVFHWPRADLDLLLCTRLVDEEDCRWSGGFVIDRIDAFHIHLRVFRGINGGNCSVFLRAEITLVDATYRVTFYDGGMSSCPSPLRFDNVSATHLVMKQADADEGLTIDVSPSSQVPYACDEPCLPPIIECTVKGGSSSTHLNMDNIGEEKVLYYENFIYIVLGPRVSESYQNPISSQGEQLVLEVPQFSYDRSVDGIGHLVTLARRQVGRRSQLWRMTSEGYLRHEGSSPPTGGKKYPHASQQGMVLDIAELEMGRGDILPLTIRKVDPKRRSQLWRFTDDGRLCCGLKNLCVQVSSSNHVGIASFLEGGVVTPNQCCRSEKMIAGSGVLSLKVVRDGPTRVIRIMDIKQKRSSMFCYPASSNSWTPVSQASSHSVDPLKIIPVGPKPLQMTFSMNMAKGVGISLIGNLPEELMYLTMSGVRLDSNLDTNSQSFGLRIQRIQIDNQLFGGRPPVMLHPYKSSSAPPSNRRQSSSATDPSPALCIEAVKLPTTNNLYEIYHSLSIDIGRICLQLEETLLLKLIQFFGSGFSPETDLSLLDETKMDLIQNTTISELLKDSAIKRYYFDSLNVKVSPMQLSVFTASNSRLDPELKAVKQASSLVLIQFERAPVVMQPYIRHHVFETTSFMLDEAKKHFTDQLRGQAAKILGSVDFLGNPIGLLSDLKAGVGSLARGSVPSLVKHITHGLSDSAAKVTGTLSNISGGITMDQDHEEKRRMIRANSTSNPGDHIVAGLHGLATGLVGGLTSIVTQTVRGATDEGAKGFFTGFGKGLVGTVTKPVTGVLDFASETASAVRDSSISSNMAVSKVRLPRSCHSFQGCIECYSESHAEYLNFLHQINGRVYDEWLYSVIEIELPRRGNMLVLITNRRLYLSKKRETDTEAVVMTAEYTNLISANTSQENNNWYLELAMKMPDNNAYRGSPMRYSSSTGSLHGSRYAGTTRKPKIECHSESTAKRICEHVNYAKMLASEQSETLPALEDDTECDKAFDLEV